MAGCDLRYIYTLFDGFPYYWHFGVELWSKVTFLMLRLDESQWIDDHHYCRRCGRCDSILHTQTHIYIYIKLLWFNADIRILFVRYWLTVIRVISFRMKFAFFRTQRISAIDDKCQYTAAAVDIWNRRFGMRCTWHHDDKRNTYHRRRHQLVFVFARQN